MTEETFKTAEALKLRISQLVFFYHYIEHLLNSEPFSFSIKYNVFNETEELYKHSINKYFDSDKKYIDSDIDKKYFLKCINTKINELQQEFHNLT
jgi:hypothetical protein